MNTADPWTLLQPSDQDLLIGTEPQELLGRIMQLNRSAPYHNQLDALALMFRIAQLRDAVMHHRPEPVEGSVPLHPDK